LIILVWGRRKKRKVAVIQNQGGRQAPPSYKKKGSEGLLKVKGLRNWGGKEERW